MINDNENENKKEKCFTQIRLSNIRSSIRKKIKQHWRWVGKSVTYKKGAYADILIWGYLYNSGSLIC